MLFPLHQKAGYSFRALTGGERNEKERIVLAMKKQKMLAAFFLSSVVAVSAVPVFAASQRLPDTMADHSAVTAMATADTAFGSQQVTASSADAGDNTEEGNVAAPTGVEAELLRSSEKNSSSRKLQVRLTWAPREKASGYWIYGRKKGAKSWILLKKGVSGDKNTYTYTSTAAILSLKAEKTYQFTVVSIDSEGRQSTIGTKKKQLPAVKVVPSVTPELRSARSISYNCNQLTWNAADGADGYLIYRKPENGSWKQIGRTTNTSYRDLSAKVGITYSYSAAQYWDVDGAQAKGSYNTSGLKVTTKLSRPALNKATAGKNSVTIKWTKVAGAQGYVVYRKKSGGSYVRLGAALKGNSSTKLTDAPAKSGKYSYKVKAYRIRGNDTYYSAYSNVTTLKFTKAAEKKNG